MIVTSLGMLTRGYCYIKVNDRFLLVYMYDGHVMVRTSLVHVCVCMRRVIELYVVFVGVFVLVSW